MKITTSKQVFDFLQGIWKITRYSESQIESENIKAEGHAFFNLSADEPGLIIYSEKVTIYNIYLNSSAIGTQEYKYKYDADSLSLSKYFSDNRFFYRLNISENKASGRHLCIEDEYSASYIFSENLFTLTYSVTGPFKSYEIKTEYVRVREENLY
jgi:hypothetical protein